MAAFAEPQPKRRAAFVARHLRGDGPRSEDLFSISVERIRVSAGRVSRARQESSLAPRPDHHGLAADLAFLIGGLRNHLLSLRVETHLALASREFGAGEIFAETALAQEHHGAAKLAF